MISISIGRKTESNGADGSRSCGRERRSSRRELRVFEEVAATLGGAEGVTALLEALAKSVGQAEKKRRAA